MEYLTDIIGEKYKSWEVNDMVFLFSGTGSGKTKLSLEKVALYNIKQGRNVLYLVPRKILMGQIKKDMMKILSHNPASAPMYNKKFTIWTYQYLENCLLRNIPIEDFDVIICDEFHYFVVDSVFNRNTEISFNYIVHSFSSLRLFLSATPTGITDYVKEYGILPSCFDFNFDDFDEDDKKGKLEAGSCRGNKNVYKYKLEKNYDYLNVKYLSNDKEILDIVNNSYGKTIIFISNKDNGLKIKKDLEDNSINCIFITAENKENDSKDDVDEIIDTNTFSKKVLITTSVLDVGVNILDTDIENMIISANEPVEFLQMLGRFRVIQEGQQVSLYIYARNAKYFQNLCYRQIKPKIECCEYLEKCSDLQEVLINSLVPGNDLPEGYDKFLYKDYINGTVAFNKAAAYRYRQLYNLYNEILDGIINDEDYFIKKQLEWLGLKNTFKLKDYYSNDVQKNRIKDFKEIIENEAKQNKEGMLKDEKTKVTKKFIPYVRKIDEEYIRSNQELSTKNFNRICKIYNIPYCIGKRQEKINNKRVEKYYLLNKDDSKIEELKLDIDY